MAKPRAGAGVVLPAMGPPGGVGGKDQRRRSNVLSPNTLAGMPNPKSRRVSIAAYFRYQQVRF